MTITEGHVDRRAARASAEAGLVQARAAAQAVLLEADVQADAARADLAQRTRERRTAERAQSRADRARRATARRVRWAARLAGALQHAHWLAGAACCASATAIAVTGQAEFARVQMALTGVMAWLIPTMLEGGAWMLAWHRHRAARAIHPAGVLSAGMWTLALTAAGFQMAHGRPIAIGAMYAAASLVGFGIVELLAHHQARATTSRQRPQVDLLRVLRYPGLAWAAWSRQIEMGPGADPAEAWTQAWADRYGCDPGQTVRPGLPDARWSATPTGLDGRRPLTLQPPPSPISRSSTSCARSTPASSTSCMRRPPRRSRRSARRTPGSSARRVPPSPKRAPMSSALPRVSAASRRLCRPFAGAAPRRPVTRLSLSRAPQAGHRQHRATPSSGGVYVPAAVAYLRDHPDAGRRMLTKPVNEGGAGLPDPPLTDHRLKLLHAEAQRTLAEQQLGAKQDVDAAGGRRGGEDNPSEDAAAAA